MIKVIAEIGINHNADIKIAKKLIDIAVIAGFDYVKFQKRNPDKCVPKEQKKVKRDTPWGKIEYINYKHRLEFGIDEYREINRYCKEREIGWFASAWDIDSAEFLKEFCDIVKIPSPLITDLELLKYCRDNFKTVIISTGMSFEFEIERAVKAGNPDVIMHCNSSYPAKISELRLQYIKWLKDKYPDRDIGYSGHEFGLTTTMAAVAVGAEWIERHITLDRMMWGSDHLSSVEPIGMIKLIKGIRDIEKSLTGYGERDILDSELEKRKSLRGENE